MKLTLKRTFKSVVYYEDGGRMIPKGLYGLFTNFLNELAKNDFSHNGVYTYDKNQKTYVSGMFNTQINPDFLNKVTAQFNQTYKDLGNGFYLKGNEVFGRSGKRYNVTYKNNKFYSNSLNRKGDEIRWNGSLFVFVPVTDSKTLDPSPDKKDSQGRNSGKPQYTAPDGWDSSKIAAFQQFTKDYDSAFGGTHNLGTFGSNKDGIDGRWGGLTDTAYTDLKDKYNEYTTWSANNNNGSVADWYKSLNPPNTTETPPPNTTETPPPNDPNGDIQVLQAMSQAMQQARQSNTNTWNKFNTGSSGRHNMRVGINNWLLTAEGMNALNDPNTSWKLTGSDGQEYDMKEFIGNNLNSKNLLKRGALRKFNKMILKNAIDARGAAFGKTSNTIPLLNTNPINVTKTNPGAVGGTEKTFRTPENIQLSDTDINGNAQASLANSYKQAYESDTNFEYDPNKYKTKEHAIPGINRYGGVLKLFKSNITVQ